MYTTIEGVISDAFLITLPQSSHIEQYKSPIPGFSSKRIVKRNNTMATLRNFQNEMEEIHHREVTKQRALNRTELDNTQTSNKHPSSPTSPTLTQNKKRIAITEYPLEDLNRLQVLSNTTKELY